MDTNNINIEFQPLPTNPLFQDLTGQTFNRWIVLGYAGQTKRRRSLWCCYCECGQMKTVRGDFLKDGHTKSCGCLQRQHATTLGQNNKTHGKSHTLEYKAFHEAKKRCENPNNKSYPDYGERGIAFRITSVQAMLEDIGLRPTPKHSLNRINNDGHYEVGNIEWATKKVQNRNTRRNHYVTVNEITHTIAEWAEITGLRPYTISVRLKRGACDYCAVTLPLGDACLHRSPYTPNAPAPCAIP